MKTKTDRELQKDVMAELEWKFPLKPAEIGVSVNDGIVTLSGFTDSYYKKREAERAAEKIEGVKAIVEKVEVKLPHSNARTDEDVAKAASNALRWDVNVPEDKVKLIVNQAWVTLEGEVDWYYQKIAAEDAVENLIGVKGVTNSIIVKPKIKPSEVSEHIKNAFRRHAQLDAERITIEIEGSKAILKGKVRSLAEKKDAERAAWLTPGVSKVENQLEISFDTVLL
ncbi:BON domain-containing protein [Catalinimonas niigatensis]|uniref:BON domain-containing protein n=1 Tax=Catalinimonas niigatensis TaxID=1397264 RepID=UPI0026669A6B|nr:BON domain-containing protein [Catalinimonas niigatensis]WPP49804.1 BON domain-containing protein [Catalinimonas niigatensis]